MPSMGALRHASLVSSATGAWGFGDVFLGLKGGVVGFLGFCLFVCLCVCFLFAFVIWSFFWWGGLGCIASLFNMVTFTFLNIFYVLMLYVYLLSLVLSPRLFVSWFWFVKTSSQIVVKHRCCKACQQQTFERSGFSAWRSTHMRFAFWWFSTSLWPWCGWWWVAISSRMSPWSIGAATPGASRRKCPFWSSRTPATWI